MFSPKEIVSYPHVASSERAAFIQANRASIAPGMTVHDVIAVLGPPDEVRPLFAPQVKRTTQIGHTYWYVVRRLRAAGNAAEQKERVVRVSFTFEGLVTGVSDWGFDAD